MQDKQEKLNLYFNLCLHELNTARSALCTLITKCQNNFDYVTKIIEITNNQESERSIATFGNTVKSFIELSEIVARFITDVEQFEFRQSTQNPPMAGASAVMKIEKFNYCKSKLEKFNEGYNNDCIITYVKDKNAGLFYITEIGRSEYENCISYIKEYFLRSPVILQNRMPRENEVFLIYLEAHLFRAIRLNSSIANGNNEYDAFLVDVGEIIKIDKDTKLYVLPENYQKIEFQAILCKLISVNSVSEVNVAEYLSKNLYVKQIFTVQKVNRDQNFLEVNLGKNNSNNPFERVISSEASSIGTEDKQNSNSWKNFTNPFEKFKIKDHVYGNYISSGTSVQRNLNNEKQNQTMNDEINKPKIRNLQEFYESDAVSDCTWKSDDDTTEFTDTDNFTPNINQIKNERKNYSSLNNFSKKKFKEGFSSTVNRRANITKSDFDDSEVEEYTEKIRNFHITEKHNRSLEKVSDPQNGESTAFDKNNSILSYLEVGQTITLQCTHIAGVEWFFGHLICHELRYGPTLSELLMKINSPHEILRYKKLHFKPDKFKLVLSQYNDGRWYRARVATPLNEEPLRVMYVDYGNIEAVTLDRLREWEPKFENLPFQAIPCRIAGIQTKGINIPAHIFLKKRMLYKDLDAKILYKKDEIWVDVKDTNGKKIAEELISRGFATEYSYLPDID